MTRHVAIVGAGPSGCFLAQALLKARPDLAVDLIDRLPVPYGLVRYGVAADHQGTKAIARQFARLFERQGARFHGNVEIGRDVPLAALRAAYDAVVLAAGLSGDRTPDLSGLPLAGVHGAGALTRALYDHPDAGPLPDLGAHPLILGNGNVALDILRLLAKTPEELDGSDLGPRATRWLADSGIETLTIVGRSPAAQARFDPVMVRELGALKGVSITVEAAPPGADDAGEKVLAALAQIDGTATGPRRIAFRFGLTPAGVLGEGGRIVALTVTRPDGVAETLPCTALVTAIGFRGDGTLPTDEGPGLYKAGWFARGPRGTIPENRADAQDLALRILADLDAAPDAPAKPGAAVLDTCRDRVDYAGWGRIDAAELAAAPANRCRQKLDTRAAMLALACRTEETQP